jgi:hypothetical protein
MVFRSQSREREEEVGWLLVDSWYCSGVQFLDGLGCIGSGSASVGGSFLDFVHYSFCYATSSIANDTTLLITLV